MGKYNGFSVPYNSGWCWQYNAALPLSPRSPINFVVKGRFIRGKRHLKGKNNWFCHDCYSFYKQWHLWELKQWVFYHFLLGGNNMQACCFTVYKLWNSLLWIKLTYCIYWIRIQHKLWPDILTCHTVAGKVQLLLITSTMALVHVRA